ncbi:MAG: hypothetical protein ACOCXP_03430 [Candidatus Dojkabacteria bacterium]
MVINSTEFQQKVGYYLDLADQGEEIVIEKIRPKGKRYILRSKPFEYSDLAEVKGNTLRDIASEYKVSYEEKDSVKYQRKVRS